MRTLAVLPVKSFSHAKQRLRDDLAPGLRRSLAEAMLRDVLSALAETEGLEDVLVVSADRRAQELAAAAGAQTLADTEAGHNAAAAIGVAAVLKTGAERVLLVPGDCPVLDPLELDELLSVERPAPSVIVVPDRHGTGTNALLLTPPDAMPPSFGPGSCARHRAAAQEHGLYGEVRDVPSLALDIDTVEDLESLAPIHGRARHTLELLARC